MVVWYAIILLWNLTSCLTWCFRLCQDIVLLKAEVAEFLLPSVIEDLAGRKNMDMDLHKLISLQVTVYRSFLLISTLYGKNVSVNFSFWLFFLSVYNSSGTFPNICSEDEQRISLMLSFICFNDKVFLFPMQKCWLCSLSENNKRGVKLVIKVTRLNDISWESVNRLWIPNIMP